MVNLSEQRKKILLEEEKYRLKVRKKLESTKRKLNRLVAFFNTNLGLFILSSVLIGGITGTYNLFKEWKKKKQTETALVNERIFITSKFLDEVIHRFKVLQFANDTLLEYRSRDVYLAVQGNTVKNGVKAQYYNFQSLYEEYGAWSIVRLMREYNKVEQDIENKNRIDAILSLLNENLDTLNHLSENFHIVTNRKMLPKGVKVEIIKKTGRNYYKINEVIYYFENGERVTRKIFKLNKNQSIEELVEKIKEFLKEVNIK